MTPRIFDGVKWREMTEEEYAALVASHLEEAESDH